MVWKFSQTLVEKGIVEPWPMPATVGQVSSPQGGSSFTFMTGVIMSDHFLRPPNMLTKFFKDPKCVD